MTETQLKPKVLDFTAIKTKEEEQNRKKKNKIGSRRKYLILAPRSYHVSIPTGLIRRNRFHLRRIPNEGDTVVDTHQQPVRDSRGVCNDPKSSLMFPKMERWQPIFQFLETSFPKFHLSANFSEID